MKFDIKDPYEFKQKELNGVPIYFNHLPWSPCTYILIGFRVGSLNDPQGKDGLSHFLEHSVLQGSTQYPSRKAYIDFKKKYTLDTLNAVTGFWRTSYTAKCLPEHFEDTFGGLWGFVLHPLLKEEEVEQERSIITQEMSGKLRNDKYIAYLKEHLNITKPNLPSKRMISAGGWLDTVANITHKDLTEWHTAHYHTGNMFIILVGNVPSSHLPIVERYIASAKQGNGIPRPQPLLHVEPPTLREKVFSSEEIGVPQNHASIGIVRHTERNVKNEEILNCAKVILDEILFEVLREEMGLCYGVRVSISSQLDCVVNSISLSLKKENVPIAIDKIFEIIKEFSTPSFKEKFYREKQIIIDRMKSAERTSSGIIDSAESMLVYDGNITPLTQIIRDTESVTFEQAAAYICTTFTKDKTYIETILP